MDSGNDFKWCITLHLLDSSVHRIRFVNLNSEETADFAYSQMLDDSQDFHSMQKKQQLSNDHLANIYILFMFTNKNDEKTRFRKKNGNLISHSTKFRAFIIHKPIENIKFV